jgi:PKD repeat protein
MAKHYLAISLDPPDPNFQQVTALDAYQPLDAQSADPLRVDLVGMGSAAGSEAALAQALLTSLERYQGAEAVNDAEWALIHARAVRDYSLLLASQTAITASAADSFAQTLAADSRPIDGLLANFESERLRILADDLTSEERRDSAAFGLTDADLAELRAALADESYAGTRAGTLADLVDAGTSSSAMAASLLAFAADMQAVVTVLEDDPGTPDDAPIAAAGGPYSIAEGVSLTLDGTFSSSPSSISAYAWDTDGDGAFDDATGATPGVTFASAFTGLVGLEVTDDEGRTDVGYAIISVSEVNHAPEMSDVEPLNLLPRMLVGATQEFSVVVSDPDGDTVSLAWQVNDSPAGSGNFFTYTPTEAETGFATIEAIATDNHPLGGSVRYVWRVIVVQADGDGDGWRANVDCDDADPAVSPDATEVVANGKDDDCDPQTPDNGAAPLAAFHTSAVDGRNVALLEGGATAISVTSPTTTLNTLRNMLNYSNSDDGWSSSTGQVTNQAAVFALAGAQNWLIDRVSIRPSPNTNGVRDFAIDVSTSGTAPADFTTVLTGTIPTNDDGLQVFTLAEPVAARYIRYRALNNRGGFSITTRQLGVFTSQQAGPTVSFLDRSTDPNGDIVTWHWDFGDGTTSSEQHPTHSYATPGSYTVTLTVSDAGGNATSASVVQKVLTPPGVNFAFSPATPLEHTAVTFNPSEAGQEGAVPVRWEWDWGDGSAPTVRLTGDNFTHLIEDSGAFTITLRVTDSSGQTGQVQRVVTTTNVAPVAGIGANQTLVWGQPWNTGQIDVSDRSPIDDLSLVCDWTFGDGQTQQVTACNEAAAEIPHSYANPGVYTSTLRVTDKDGGTASDSAIITVTERESAVQFTHAQLLPGNLVELTIKLHDRFDWDALPGETVSISLGTTTTTLTTGPDGTAGVTLPVPDGVESV